MLALTNNTVSSLVLFEQVCLRTGFANTDDNYAQFCSHMLATLIHDTGFSQAAQFAFTTNGDTIRDLNHGMCMAIVATMSSGVMELTNDVNYLFYGTKALQGMQQLHTAHATVNPEPLGVDEYAMNSLEFVELINKARGPSKSAISHCNLLKKITKLQNDRAQVNFNASYLDLRIQEDAYVDKSGRASKMINMSADFTLSLSMTYDLQTRDIVQNEMNRLRGLVNSVQYLPTVQPVDITVPYIAPEPMQMYYSIEQAEDMFGGVYGDEILHNAGANHRVSHIHTLYNNKSVKAYSVVAWECAYRIFPEAWTVVPLPTIQATQV